VFGLTHRRNDDADTRPSEPRTVPETQRWLSSNGYRECTERDAGRALFMRGLVRDGTVSDDDKR
jgi:hypothetical protein